MSASLETVGVATAAVSRVMVTSHDASSADFPKISGKSGSNGITMDCCSDTTVAHNDKIPKDPDDGPGAAWGDGLATATSWYWIDALGPRKNR